MLGLGNPKSGVECVKIAVNTLFVRSYNPSGVFVESSSSLEFLSLNLFLLVAQPGVDGT